MKKFITGFLISFYIIFLSSIAYGSRESSTLMNRAVQLSIKGEHEKAREIILEIIKKEPGNMYAHNNLGTILLSQGKYDEAITFFQNALKINPRFSMSLNNIGKAYKLKGNYPQAELFLKKAIKNFSDFDIAMAHLGEVYFLQKRYDEAIVYLEKAVKSFHVEARYHNLLGKAYEAKNMKSKAEKEFNRYNQLKKKP